MYYTLYIHVQLCQSFMVSMYETATCTFEASIGISTILQSSAIKESDDSDGKSA